MTDDIILRSSSEEDLSFILNAEKLAAAEGFVASWTKDEHRMAFERLNTYHKTVLLEGERVGYLIMNLDANDNVELQRLVITRRHQGLGQRTLKAVKELAFETMACHRLWLDVRIHNHYAMKTYKAMGFVEEGILRECVKLEKGYVSIKIMSILKEEYETSITR